jgi:hypothetical protein
MKREIQTEVTESRRKLQLIEVEVTESPRKSQTIEVDVRKFPARRAPSASESRSQSQRLAAPLAFSPTRSFASSLAGSRHANCAAPIESAYRRISSDVPSGLLLRVSSSSNSDNRAARSMPYSPSNANTRSPLPALDTFQVPIEPRS